MSWDVVHLLSRLSQLFPYLVQEIVHLPLVTTGATVLVRLSFIHRPVTTSRASGQAVGPGGQAVGKATFGALNGMSIH